MKAVVRSGPPKQMLVVTGSSVATKSTMSPPGDTTVMPPLSSVATHTLPAPSTASESRSCMPGRPARQSPGPMAGGASSPGAVTRRCVTRPCIVSAQYSVVPSSESPSPLGDDTGNATSRMAEPSASA